MPGTAIKSPLVLLIAGLAAVAACPELGTNPGPEEDQAAGSRAIVDTGQDLCFDDVEPISCPQPGEPFAGQDAQHAGPTPSYRLSSDGLTVLDLSTGLTWQRSPDTDGDGTIAAADKLSWAEAQARPSELNAMAFGGHDDWRLPSITELYSLIQFSGSDPSTITGDDTSGLTPFIDDGVFDYAYGDTAAGERIIDSQYASDTLYASLDGGLLFGVNFADGRIKGYGLQLGGAAKTFFVLCVRGTPGYGVQALVDHGDGTISDLSSGLMWEQADSGAGMDWQAALAWAEDSNASSHQGHSDWRLPSAKELQSLLDYSRSPDSSGSAAIDPLFDASAIVNEAGEADYPWYWSSTTHLSSDGTGHAAVYVAFGRALGDMDGSWQDVHGAGAQRSDPKAGDPADFPTGRGPQGDAIRILNHVRLVRDAELASFDEGPIAAFSWFLFSPAPGSRVQFFDASLGEPDSWQWSFSDNGASSVEQNPVHSFAATGSFEVSLSVSNASGTSVKTRTVTVQAPSSSGGTGGPLSCTSQAECEAPGACPVHAALGCGCETTPTGDLCIPLCGTAEDCPQIQGQTFTCSVDGTCVPEGGPPPGP
ncbi:MAG: DUF1566 domain-containing protein [Pseudomonadota bacterium]